MIVTLFSFSCILLFLIICAITIFIVKKREKIRHWNLSRKVQHLKKVCILCRKKVKKNHYHFAILTCHKLNVFQDLPHAFHPLCVKEILSDPEKYINQEDIVKIAIACFDQFQIMEDSKRKENEWKQKEKEQLLENAKRRNLDVFLEESKGVKFL